jgi:tetratricopeptide (TPR) repeat protein
MNLKLQVMERIKELLGKENKNLIDSLFDEETRAFSDAILVPKSINSQEGKQKINPRELLKKSETHFRSKEYKQVIALLSRNKKYIENNASLLHLLADSYHELSDYKNAIIFYENALKIEPNRYWSLFNLAKLYSNCVIKKISLDIARHTSIDRTLTLFFKLASHYPDSEAPLFKLQELYKHLNKIDEWSTINNLILLRRQDRQINSNRQQKIDFMLIGSMKSATTTLFELISLHPKFSKPVVKEIHYYSVNYPKGKSWYLSNFLFKDGDCFTGEASTSYLDYLEVPYRLKQDDLCDRFIVILRNPIDRLISNYNHMLERNQLVKNISLEQSINEQLDSLENAKTYLLSLASGKKIIDRHHLFFNDYYQFFIVRSLYAIFLKHWESVFDKEKIHIVTFNKFVTNPQTILDEIFNFLNIDSYSPENIESYKLNVGKQQHRGISEKTLERLVNFLNPFNDILSQEYDINF